MQSYYKLTRSHDYFSPMTPSERQRYETGLAETPLDDLISTATLKMVNVVERGLRRFSFLG